jgi:hypothetical protein
MSADISVLDIPSSVSRSLSESALVIERALDGLLGVPSGAESRLIEAMRYAALGGGKRLRGFLVLEVSSLFGVAHACAVRVAASVEMLHAYSLAHDDLPAMDDEWRCWGLSGRRRRRACWPSRRRRTWKASAHRLAGCARWRPTSWRAGVERRHAEIVGRPRRDH